MRLRAQTSQIGTSVLIFDAGPIVPVCHFPERKDRSLSFIVSAASRENWRRRRRRAVGEVARKWFVCYGMWLEKKLKHRVNAIGRGTTDGVSLAFGIADPGASPKGLAGVGRLPSSTFAVCASKWQDSAITVAKPT